MAFYTILLGNSGYDIVALKATTAPTTGTNWSEQDGSVRVETSGGKVVSMWAVEDSSDIHIATQQETDGRVRYHVFDPGTDTWTTKNEYVASVGDHSSFDGDATFSGCSISLRSDGDVVIAFTVFNSGIVDDGVLIISKTTNWGAIQIVEETSRSPVLIAAASDDRITCAYNKSDTDTVRTRSLSNTDTLGTAIDVDTTADTATSLVGYGVVDTANELWVPYIDASDQISVAQWTSAADPTGDVTIHANVSDNTVKGNSTSLRPQVLACLAVKTDDVHLLYADDTTQDIFHDDDVDGGGTTDVERNDAVTANRLSCNYLSISDNLAWLYLDGTNTVYDEFSLAAAPTGLPIGSLALLGVGL